MCEIVSATYRGDPTANVTTAVISALAAAEDVDPMNLDFTLAEYVDADALEKVVGSQTAPGGVEVSFSVRDYDVAVESTGEVVVTSREMRRRSETGARDG
jgi:hypothetical protein